MNDQNDQMQENIQSAVLSGTQAQIMSEQWNVSDLKSRVDACETLVSGFHQRLLAVEVKAGIVYQEPVRDPRGFVDRLLNRKSGTR